MLGRYARRRSDCRPEPWRDDEADPAAWERLIRGRAAAHSSLPERVAPRAGLEPATIRLNRPMKRRLGEPAGRPRPCSEGRTVVPRRRTTWTRSSPATFGYSVTGPCARWGRLMPDYRGPVRSARGRENGRRESHVLPYGYTRPHRAAAAGPPFPLGAPERHSHGDHTSVETGTWGDGGPIPFPFRNHAPNRGEAGVELDRDRRASPTP